MIGIVIFTLITLTFSLEPSKNNDDEIKQVIKKYVDKIPDMEPKYVMSDGISNMIAKHYKGKINTFPLFRISLKIDRNAVKIPWTLGTVDTPNDTSKGKHFYVKVKKP